MQKELEVMLVFFAITIVSVTLFALASCNVMDYMACKRSAKIKAIDYKYDIFAGCFYWENNRWQK